jgi:hypothetical protein
LSFLGYILPFDASAYSDKSEIHAKPGCGEEPHIVCSIGGTVLGRELLMFCGKAYPILKEKLNNLRIF